MEVHQRLMWARLNVGRYKTASDAARAMGVPIPTYAGHENGSRGLTRATAERYAAFFKVAPEWMVFGRGAPRPGVAPPSEDREPKTIPDIPFADEPATNVSGPVALPRAGVGRLPIRGRAAGGPNGKLVMTADAVGWARMPASLQDVPEAYGVFVHGDSMLDRYESGEFLHVNPVRPVRRGDYVVAQIREQDGFAGYVKRFVSRSATELVLEQLNPPEGEDRLMRFPADRVVAVHKVVGTGEP
ncbi:LexA family transcriptional regulator [Enterovirga aerilata]|uniref:Helix-turn-helix transcriptional regulator n=1 Tax=Enterovirga aerilata TaxID=2730920 RepID=A0A849IAU6_9HYPH|nr:XRE family transcriptional regulator [Enterovirga sp. DB1703]NNM75024.1 helix-turn-helix transcriptional regulator [Enterovirga sp. DB1703]